MSEMSDFSLEWAILDGILGDRLYDDRDVMGYIKDRKCPDCRIYVHAFNEWNRNWTLVIYKHGTSNETFVDDKLTFEEIVAKLTDPSFLREHKIRLRRKK